ncbi:serine/threonine-protein kinase ATR [Arachis duranensis]|uniref:Serine/threonine-protein kinase ATR n=1 Tax=Arachis duranensis TaxID=130453 RepID=A0A6P4BR41_ARADU|nr:serine/threonine-protein kinase ATR [Arachis duranensis]
MAKAKLSSLVHELRERIAASSSTPTTTTTTNNNVTASDDDALEVRFRTVLPNLINAYLLPYSSANEREAIAVVKLVSHTAKYFPGVFFHGSDSASLLPILARLLPFFSDPLFRSRHAVFFEAIGSLLSLLRTGARDAFRHFFLDAMLAVQDVVHVASLCHQHDCNDGSSTSKFTIKCFCDSFSGIGDLPATLKPVDGYGLLIDLSGQARWQPFATWILKLISKCITEGTLYVEGLIGVSFVSAACSLLCYGDSDLHMACFDLVHILGTVTNYDIIPYYNLILSICTILNVDKEGLPVFRNMAYDSSMGICLTSLYSSCPEDVVKLTAADLVSVFRRSLSRTKSQELKVALCSAYARIARVCPPHIWQPEYLISALYQLEDLFRPLIDCFQVALSTLGPHLVGGVQGNDNTLTTLASNDQSIQSMRLGLKRPIEDVHNPTIKRQKVNEEIVVSDASLEMECKYSGIVTCQRVEDYADHMNKSLLSFVQSLNAPAVSDALLSLRPMAALSALSMLCITFSIYPETNIYFRIFQQMHAWLPWIVEQAKAGNSITIDISIYLEGIHSILLSQRAAFKENNNLLQDKRYREDFCVVLKLPWTHMLPAVDNHCPWKAKCLSLQVLSKLGPNLSSSVVLEVLDMGLHDEAEKVRTEAVISMPVMLFWSTLDISSPVIEKIEYIKRDNEKVKKLVPITLGLLSCLYGCRGATSGLHTDECKLFLNVKDGKPCWSVDCLLQNFSCSKCDRIFIRNHGEQHPPIIHQANGHGANVDVSLECNLIQLQSLFFELLFDESSHDVQISCVKVIHRILAHGSADTLIQNRFQWIKCVEFLLISRSKELREAFCSQISSFADNLILSLIFPGDVDKSKEQKFLDTIQHAMTVAESPQILETLMECIAEIMSAVNVDSKMFLYCLILLVDRLDSMHVAVRMNASRLIHKACYFHLKGGLELILLKDVHICTELYDYISERLASRPVLVKEFAEAVYGIETEELVKKMIPFVLPKLVVCHQDNNQAVDTLHELAKCLNTDMVPLIVNWLPKVLAFALHQADDQKLLASVQFYHAQTGSNKQEIFAAALPALLDELICFTDGGDSDEINIRLARVPQMIKGIAIVLTGGDDLPGFLRNHFVGLLNSIDRKLLHADDFVLRRQALKRIEMLIRMMGSHLNTYVPKLMVLLMHAIGNESLQKEGLSVLHFFIRQLAEVSPSSIKHIISQVFASLLPFLERDKENPSTHLDKVVEILKELSLKNTAILKQHICEFPPLPSIPALTEVNKAIEDARGSSNLKDQLRDVVDGLNHENLNVRYMVACELCKLLNLRWKDVTALITAESGSDLDVLSLLITSLLRGCAEESRTAVGQRLKLVCADCLGALGAVDPAKVKSFSCQRFKIQCSDDDLIFELIHKHLARAFRSAPDTVIQDSAALAIQELLKFAGCEASLDENAPASTSQEKKDEDNSNSFTSKIKRSNCSNVMNNRGQKLWGRFSNYVKEIIAPCLTSRFQLPKVPESTSAGPIYRPSMSFRRWIFFWIRKLTMHATGSRASIFNACRGIVRHDMQTAIYLLPYLVLNAVCHGTQEARHSITEEILSVLDAAASENSGAPVHGYSGGQSEVCIQAVFTLLDNLGQWVDDVEQGLALSLSNSSASKQQNSKDPTSNSLTYQDQLLVQCKYVSELLSAIPKVTLASASFRCQAYARSLMYFESYVREKSGAFNPAAERSGIFQDEDVSHLMEIYSCLDEPDGLFGLSCLSKSLRLQDQLLINKKDGNWADVLTSCEQALQMEPTSVQRHSDVLNCLLNMCHLQAMVTHVDGLISRIPQYKKAWSMQGVQAAWRLGRWDLMNEYLSGADEEGLVCSSSESNASFDLDVAMILQAMMKRDHFSVAEKIALSKQSLIAPLAAAGMDSYMRAYPFVVKLHFLRELEDFHSLLGDDSFLEKSFHLGDFAFSKLVENWDNRIRFTQSSLWAREPLLALRRLVFSASSLRPQVGNCWLQYSKLCRLAGHYETANRAILEAQACGAPNVHMENAKLLWSTRRSDGAIAVLQQSLLNMPVEVLGCAALSSITSLSLVPLNPAPIVCESQSPNENRDIAKTLLLYSRWIHYTGQKQKEDVISLYTRVRELQPKWEKGYFYIAKYCDEVLGDARKRQEENIELGPRRVSSKAATVGGEMSWWSYLPDVLLFYAKGLHRGHKNLFQALPRLLTLWFDFGSMCQRSGSSNKDLKSIHGKVMSIMRGCLKDLPTYHWLTVLPQLVSRICHQNEEIVRLVKLIIISVLRQYPQQGLWIMAAVSKSTVPSRREAAAEIIQGARKGFSLGSNENSLFVQFASLIDHLIKLCFHPGQPRARTINLSTEFSALKRMMPLGIIMPIQQSLTVNLPTVEGKPGDSLMPDIFPATDLPTIAGISDEAEILSSLQRPKKIILLGSDGLERPFLCKPKDDLRKDARMMEFTAMINRLLSKYPESRRRKLYIRTFAVIPLTEDCGMVEWVPHTRGLRQILQDVYITCGKYDRQKTNGHIKRIYDQCQGKMPEDEMLKGKILPMFPPVFHKWFLTTFSEPAAWFRARVAYAHTTAVWSMVGHIVGLGDRHGENILFDSTSGDCVHVDFSCLFDKGLQLEKPELVPFRLTQNMIDGLGITGYEGIFLRVCEITLSVLRTHRETLMSVLETFIHDPLVEWTKSHKSSGVEVQNPHAQRAISNIEARLQGVVVGVGAAPSLPLAVEGQARRLIAEAVSHKNLGKMYIWWMPWF